MPSAEKLKSLPSQLIAEVTLYPAEEGGKKSSVTLGWGCLCCGSKSPPVIGYDGWPLLGDAKLAPGDKRRLGFVFDYGEEAAAELRKAGTFYLWEGRFIGEAVIVA